MAAAALVSVAAPAVAAPMVQGRVAASTQDGNDLRSRKGDREDRKEGREGRGGFHGGSVLIALLAAAAIIAGIIIAVRGNDNPVSR